MEAHPVAQGAMEIVVSADKIQVQARVSMEEVLVQNTLSPGPAEPTITLAELCRRHGNYLLEHLTVSVDGQPLVGKIASVLPPQGPGPQRAIYDFEYPLGKQSAQIRVSQNVLNEFDYAPGNRWEATYVVRVQQQNRSPVDVVLLTSREPLVIDCPGGAPTGGSAGSSSASKWRLTKEYAVHGILHILTGYDHLLFIGALILAVVTLWDLIKVVTAFTLAHSLTMTLSVFDLVRLPEQVVEPIISASIVFVALQNVFWPARSRGAARLGVAFFFGLFHGLGFAGGLLSAMEGMAGLTIGLAILAFSVGVEIGHQVVVLPLFGGLTLLRRVGRSPRLAEAITQWGSIAIALAGLYYLVLALR